MTMPAYPYQLNGCTFCQGMSVSGQEIVGVFDILGMHLGILDLVVDSIHTYGV